MSAAGATSTLRTVMPLMSMPRIELATRSASSVLAASFTPPALPRPPTRTWALMTTDPTPVGQDPFGGGARLRGRVGDLPGGHGQPLGHQQGLGVGFLDLHAMRLRFEGERPRRSGRSGRDGREADGTASNRPGTPKVERTDDPPLPYSRQDEAVGPPSPAILSEHGHLSRATA